MAEHVLALVVSSALAVVVVGDFQLTVLHTNDVHSRIEETNKYGANCTEDDGERRDCYGGVARRYAAAEAIRRNHGNVLLLDAGDEFQGTVWFSYYNGLEASHFMNRLRYDAMALGNHDFDNGPVGLLSPFLENVSFPVLACNVNFSRYPEIQRRVRPYTIVNFTDGVVGIIGYTTPDTTYLVHPSKIENITFYDILPSVRQYVSMLRDQGVNKIIALGHSGYSFSQQVAAIPGVDIVVDGHSHTFLYNGDPPSNEEVRGPYPTEVPQSDGGSALVYQAYAYGKYLGMTEVTFDDEGKVKNWSGNPILLDNTWPQDPKILDEIDEWRKPLVAFTKTEIGESYVLLQGGKSYCRTGECNLGNLLTDAVWHKHIRPPADSRWTLVRIVLWNGGGIRTSLKKGPITTGNIMEANPFRNKIELAWVTGSTLRKVFEHSVTAFNPEDPAGRFLQISGVKVTYDLSKPEGSRVVQLMVVCIDCDVPDYRPLEDNMTYPLLVNDYLLAGGDGYSVLRDNILNRRRVDTTAVECLVSYIQSTSPVFPGVEGRITFADSDPSDGQPYCGLPVTGAAPARRRSITTVFMALCLVSGAHSVTAI